MEQSRGHIYVAILLKSLVLAQLSKVFQSPSSYRHSFLCLVCTKYNGKSFYNGSKHHIQIKKYKKISLVIAQLSKVFQSPSSYRHSLSCLVCRKYKRKSLAKGSKHPIQVKKYYNISLVILFYSL